MKQKIKKIIEKKAIDFKGNFQIYHSWIYIITSLISNFIIVEIWYMLII